MRRKRSSWTYLEIIKIVRRVVCSKTKVVKRDNKKDKDKVTKDNTVNKGNET